MDGCNPPDAECGKDRFCTFQRRRRAAGRGIPAVEKRMQEESLRAAFCGQFQCREQLFFMTVNAAGG